MKKLLLFAFSALFLFLLDSCKKQEVKRDTSSPTPSGGPTKWDKTKKGRAARSGDGLYDVLGWGYDATGEFANANSVGFQVIDLDAFKASNPARVVISDLNESTYYEEYGADALAFSFKVSSQVDASLTEKLPLFGDVLTAGFSSSLTSSGKFDGKYIYGSYNLRKRLKKISFNSDVPTLQNYLTPEFLSDVNTYYTNPQVLVQKYGTHVLLNIYTGGKLDLVYQAETKNTDRETAARAGVKAAVKDNFNLTVENNVDATIASQNYSRKLFYRTRGGDASTSLVGTINLDQTNPKVNTTAWENSCNPTNAVMVDIERMGMAFMYDFIADPVKRAAVKAFVDQYLIDGQTRVDYLSVPVYRYWGNGNDHFYTISSVHPGPAYAYEGIGFYAYSYKAPGTVPVYRYWGNGNDHFYLVSSVHPGPAYVYEGIEFYAYPYQAPGTVPIYRYWSNKMKDHYYIKTAANYKDYVYEGIEFYAY